MEWPDVARYLKTKVHQFGDARLLVDYEPMSLTHTGNLTPPQTDLSRDYVR